MDSACIIIPARYASSRYPGKPLALLRGAGGVAKTLLERSVGAARQAAQGADIPIYVATDDARIADEARRIGADVIMTAATCRNGTERVAEAAARAGIAADIIINLQGDAPLTPPHFITALLDTMRANPAIGMATPMLRSDSETVANLIADRREGRVGATTVVASLSHKALYFSKEVIPFTNGKGVVDGPGGSTVPVFHHVGVYAYRPLALRAYASWPEGPLERLEGLEQLRFLENDHQIHMVEVTAQNRIFWELNNPSDVALIEGYLARIGTE
jgi:3-deoxy-manno-octulosonate cytidylyltransferase (CMP-KDO synthetase)